MASQVAATVSRATLGDWAMGLPGVLCTQPQPPPIQDDPRRLTGPRDPEGRAGTFLGPQGSEVPTEVP